MPDCMIFIQHLDLQEVGYQGSSMQRINFLAIGLVSFISWVENDCLMDGDDGWIQMMCFFVNFLNKLKSRNIPYNFLWSGASKPAPSTPSSQTINCVQSSVCGITGWSWMVLFKHFIRPVSCSDSLLIIVN